MIWLILLGCFTKGMKAIGALVKGRNNLYKIKDVASHYDCMVKHCRRVIDCSHFTYIDDIKECYLKTKEAIEPENLMHSDDPRKVTFGPGICKSKKTLYII